MKPEDKKDPIIEVFFDENDFGTIEPIHSIVESDDSDDPESALNEKAKANENALDSSLESQSRPDADSVLNIESSHPGERLGDSVGESQTRNSGKRWLGALIAASVLIGAGATVMYRADSDGLQQLKAIAMGFFSGQDTIYNNTGDAQMPMSHIPMNNEPAESIESRVNRLVDLEIGKFREDAERLAEVQRSIQADQSAIKRSIEGLRDSQLMMTSEIDSLKNSTAEIQSGRQSLADRLTRLEQALARQSVIKRDDSNTQPTTKRVALEPKPTWEITAMSGAVAILRNSSTGEAMRVAMGHPIPGCGNVKELNVSQNIVRTTNGCVVHRRRG